MLTKKTIQCAIAVALFAAAAIPALTQETGFGNWQKIAGQPELEYRWRAQTGSDGKPMACEVQVRGLDRDTNAPYVGKLEFTNSSGGTILRPLEVNIHAGRVFDTKVGTGCAGVTNLRIAPRVVTH